LDHNAFHHPNLFFVATSNFTTALDGAFLSRSDAAILVPLPGPDAVQQILKNTLLSLAETFPGLRQVALAPGLAAVAAEAAGLDGRRVRKLVFEALSLRLETVLDPAELTMRDLAATAASAVEQDLAAQKENAHVAV
jgi:SpoVK/Ycf46/Vps4 family AAA+-type ATPase